PSRSRYSLAAGKRVNDDIEWLGVEIEQVIKPSNLAVEARIGQKNKITRRCARRVRCAAASRAVTTETPHKRESRRRRIPEEPLVLYEGGNSDALFSGEVQFFDFLIVGLSPEEGLVTSPEVSSDGVCFKTRLLRLVRLVVWQSE
ncbi:MAG: hypothetical protein WBE62_10520, partial [Methylocella sp.]